MDPEALPSPKKFCLGLDIDSLNSAPDRAVRCSTPEGPSVDNQQLDTSDEEQQVLGLSYQSIESFIEDVDEEEILDLTVNTQPLSQCLDDGKEGKHDITVDYKEYHQAIDVREKIEKPETIHFPVEILENILSRLSLIDLLTSACLVCKQWNQVITIDPSMCFIKWKMAYYKLRHEQTVRMSDLLPMFKPVSVCQFIGFKVVLEIASHVKKEFSRINSTLKHMLQKHEQYPCVSLLSNSALTKSLSDLEELVVLVACCHTVHQLLHLVDLVTTPVSGGFSSPCLTYMEVSEVLYLIATLFLTYWNGDTLPPRFHYNVFYVLDVMERNSTPTRCHPLQACAATENFSNTSRMSLTSEQLRIINHPLQHGQTIKVVALAGTGKTTTFYHLTRLNPKLKFLYCVFNKSVQQYADSVIFSKCKNVKVRTFHSLAYRNTGFCYGKIKKLGSDLTATFISWELETERLSFEYRMILAKVVKDTLSNYFASRDEVICEDHIPSRSVRFLKATILKESKSYWKKMMCLDSDCKVKMTHNGYLKLFQLKRSKELSKDFDVILVDEAQDLTPAIIDILTNQDSAKIVVGDPNQQIYSFLGASNALDQIEATRTYHLTRSFRFGPEIAYASALALYSFHSSGGQFFVGSTQKGSINGFDVNGQVAIISRLNCTMFDEVVKVIRNNKVCKIAFTGVTKMAELGSNYGFTLLEDIFKLMNGANTSSLKSPQLKWGNDKTYKDFLKRALKTDDKALLGRIDVVQKYGDDIPIILKEVRKRVTFNLKLAGFIFSTAHKSKGLEFDTVKISDDFLSGDSEHSDHRAVDEQDEKNLVYVAMTRAKRNLILSQTIFDILRNAGETFVFPTIVQGEVRVYADCFKGQATACTECAEKDLSPLRLKMPPFYLSDIMKAGFSVCRGCCPIPIWRLYSGRLYV